jgi:hypothetical protein
MNMGRNVHQRASREARSISLLRNSHVELVWDKVVVSLRQADLVVIHTTLRQWMSEGERDGVATYLLTLNQCRIPLAAVDLYHFCSMVEDAVAQLPRQSVRWPDLEVHIEPLSSPLSSEVHISTGTLCFN